MLPGGYNSVCRCFWVLLCNYFCLRAGNPMSVLRPQGMYQWHLGSRRWEKVGACDLQKLSMGVMQRGFANTDPKFLHLNRIYIKKQVWAYCLSGFREISGYLVKWTDQGIYSWEPLKSDSELDLQHKSVPWEGQIAQRTGNRKSQ